MSAGHKHNWECIRSINDFGIRVQKLACIRCGKKIEVSDNELRLSLLSPETRAEIASWCVEPTPEPPPPPPPKTIDDCFALLEKIAGKLEIPIT